MNILGLNIEWGKQERETIENGRVRLSAKEKEKRVIRITEWSNERSRKDLRDVAYAIGNAENVTMPRWWELIKLYEELERDSHMIMLRNRYRRHLTGRAFVLKDKKTGKTDLEATKLLKKRWFMDLLKYKSDSKFFGNSIVQIDEVKDGEIKKVSLVKRKFIIPQLGGYIQQQGSAEVINYRNDPQLMKWLFEADNGDFGYFFPAAPYILFKKNALIAWSELVEVFGLPIRYVETDNTSPKDIARIKSALINIAKSASGIFHTGESIKFAEIQRADTYKVFDMLKEACNMELSKMILGETMSSDVGSTGGNRALGEVHQHTSKETAEENRADAVTWINEHVMPTLIIHGYKFDSLEFDYPAVPEFNEAEWKVIEGLLKEFDIEPQYFIDKYALPITGAKKKQEATPPDPNKLKAALEVMSKSDSTTVLKMHLAIQDLLGEHEHEEDEEEIAEAA